MVHRLVGQPVDLLPERLVAHRGGGAAGWQHEPGADVLEHRLRPPGRMTEAPLEVVLRAEHAQLQQREQLLRVLADRQHPLAHRLSEDLEGMVIRRAQHLGQLRGQLEAGRELEAAQLLESLAAGGAAEHEAEVDVQDVPRVVDQDVAVVPIADREDVAHDGVRRHGPDEVHHGRVQRDLLGPVLLAGDPRVGRLKVRFQGMPLVSVALLEVAQAHGVRDGLEAASVVMRRDDEERVDPVLHPVPLEDPLEPLQEPVGELLLADVVGVGLHDHGEATPLRSRTEVAQPAHALDHLLPGGVHEGALRPQVLLGQVLHHRLVMQAADRAVGVAGSVLVRLRRGRGG
mmetsp:Transcript_69235/g.149352  ORF Transcript_69235/g.149352 Transcript_69235/m.149352 type:complete len:344 (-) Transcript_69235:1119-2150(-)